jgi:hypothetical protein
MINPPQVRPEEPTAVTPHGGFCGGKSQQWLRYPTKPHARICEGESRMAELLDHNCRLERPHLPPHIAIDHVADAGHDGILMNV